MQYRRRKNQERPKQVLPRRYCHKQQDDQIFPQRYYCWYYDGDLRRNLAPVSWEDRVMARFVLKSTFGQDIFKKKKIHILKGTIAKRRGLKLGSKVIYIDGVAMKIPKFYIPPEYRKNKSSRRYFLRLIYSRPWEEGIKRYKSMVYGR